MRLKSRGLGRKELVMDFREYEVIREGDEIIVVGQIRDPVNWDFSIRLCEDDLAGIVRVACNPRTLGLLLRALFRRHKRHHWSQEHTEHIAEGRRRLAEAREKAAARSQAARAPAPPPQLPDSGPSALG